MSELKVEEVVEALELKSGCRYLLLWHAADLSSAMAPKIQKLLKSRFDVEALVIRTRMPPGDVLKLYEVKH